MKLVLGWIDSHDNESYALVDTITSAWGRTPVIDLSTLWAGETIKKVWLRFDPISLVASDVRVRVGRVWLEEAKP